MIRLILAGLALTAVTVVLHGVLTAVAAGSVSRRWFPPTVRLDSFGAELLIARLVGSLLLVHLADAMVWAIFFTLDTATSRCPSCGVCSVRSKRRWGCSCSAGPRESWSRSSG